MSEFCRGVPTNREYASGEGKLRIAKKMFAFVYSGLIALK